jgi:hypothetical protein
MHKGQKQLLVVFIATRLFVRRVIAADEFVCWDMANIRRQKKETLLVYKALKNGST